MQGSALPWRKLTSYCASIEDGSYLEQKVSSLMTALEFFTRTSLHEMTPLDRAAHNDMTLPDLIGAARKELAWDIPKHYTERELYRLLKNAVAHGSELPTSDSAEVRHIFDKWRLFLFRRVLIRLGYRGWVFSPDRGWAACSLVEDLTEAHNTFSR